MLLGTAMSAVEHYALKPPKPNLVDDLRESVCPFVLLKIFSSATIGSKFHRDFNIAVNGDTSRCLAHVEGSTAYRELTWSPAL
jgi:hypothetical protein